jgi:restriction system protein
MIEGSALSYLVMGLAPTLLLIEPAIDRLFRHRRGKRLYHKNKGRSTEALKKLDWKDFEHLCAGYFIKKGYSVQMSGLGGADGGMDLVLRRQGKKYLVQCKHWKSRVGVAVVREMFGVMHAEQFSGVFIVGLSGFTRDAWTWSAGKPIKLMDGKALLTCSAS